MNIFRHSCVSNLHEQTYSDILLWVVFTEQIYSNIYWCVIFTSKYMGIIICPKVWYLSHTVHKHVIFKFILKCHCSLTVRVILKLKVRQKYHNSFKSYGHIRWGINNKWFFFLRVVEAPYVVFTTKMQVDNNVCIKMMFKYA